MKKALLTWSIILLSFCSILAQRTITGTVKSDKNDPLVGASVVVKGTTAGAITDLDGTYSVAIPTNATTLVISFTGFQTQEVAIGASNVIDVTLAEGALMNEVVIGAFGIKKDKSNLGYDVSQVSAEELTTAHTTNITNALAAKVPGIRLSGSGGSFSSSSITVRGLTSFTGSNQPLFVVDGIAIDNSGGGNALQTGVTNSGRAIDIDQENVESISVLKGAAATSLYGSRAANGVILITTKSGKAKSKQSVTYNVNVQQQEVNRLPDYQNIYGQGNNITTAGIARATFNPAAIASWGPRIDGRTVPLPNAYRGATPSAADSTSLIAYPNNVSDLFRKGINTQHSLAFQGGTDATGYRLSFGYLDDNGILDNNRLRRYNVGINATSQLTDKLQAGVAINYTYNISKRTQQGNQLSSPLFRTWFTPRSWDLTGRPYESATGANLHYDAVDNPRWTIYNNLYDDETNRVFGNFNLRYVFNDWLTATYKLGADTYDFASSFYDQIGANGQGATIAQGIGGIREIRNTSRLFNSILLLQADKKLTQDLSLTFVLGNEVVDQTQNNTDLIGRGVTVRNFRNLAANTTTILPAPANINGTPFERWQSRLYGYFANATLSYKNWGALDIGLRNDNNSVLSSTNNSYFYPSGAVAINLDKILDIKSTVLTGLKLRGSTGRVGSAKADFRYATDSYYGRAGVSDGFGPAINFPFNGQPGFTLQNAAGNPDLKPEFTTSTEGGLEFDLLAGKITFSGTIYRQQSTDVLLFVPVSSAAGISSVLRNAGSLTTNGIELQMGLNPFRNANGFSWSTNVNYTQFKSIVDSLAPGVPVITLAGFVTPNIRLVAGDEYGQIYGNAYVRDANGKMVVNATTGLPLITPNVQKIGNPNPKFQVNIGNSFSYKGLELSVLLEIKEGGEQYSRNLADLQRNGVAIETATVERLNADGTPATPYIFDAVTPTGEPNTKAITSEQYWGNAGKYAAAEGFIYNTSWFRIREAALNYRLPQSIFKNTAIGSVIVGVFGRNLFLYAPGYPHLDPEQNVLGVSNAQGLEFNALPQTRTMGANLRVTF